MLKVFIPSIIIGLVLLCSVITIYRCAISTAWWRWFALFPILLLYIILYGFTWGFWQLKVTELTFESEAIPESFDGYKIAQIADLHCGGAFWGPYRGLLGDGVEKVNSLKPDMICVVGDLQNFLPKESMERSKELSALKAPDGVYSIMGNHDYASYSGLSPKAQAEQIALTKKAQASFGWTMLNDEHRYIYRETKQADGTVKRDSICVIGEENWGLPPFPQKGDIKKAVSRTSGVTATDSTVYVPIKDNTETFSILLSHDPNAWRHHVLPVFRPDIMLAGHTHGTQFSFFGMTPASMTYDEWGGFYYDNNGKDSREPTGKKRETLLSVSTGFGGNLPFRFGMPREIVLITLKHKR